LRSTGLKKRYQRAVALLPHPTLCWKKGYMRFSQKVAISIQEENPHQKSKWFFRLFKELSYDQAIPLLGVPQRKHNIYRDIYTLMSKKHHSQ
jgi:hypothetical protein